MDPFSWLFIFLGLLGLALADHETSKDFCENQECSSFTKTSSQPQLARCKRELGKKAITSLSGMVGMGWDNLQNLPMAQVLNSNFAKCLTTPDDEFLIPDDMQIVPIKNLHLDKTASYHSTLSEYVNANAESINIHAGGSWGGCGASGSFSASHQFAKKQFATASMSMFVTTIDYLAYKTLVQSATDLHPEFKQRLRLIHDAISRNLTARARYLSQLVIRDFGTHLVTAADVGARIQQEDFVSMQDSESSDSTIWSMKAAASASFFSVVNVGASAAAKVSDEEKQRVSDRLSHSKIVTKGGPNVNRLLRTDNGTTPSFEIDDLVVTDRSGVPLFTLINENTMPELEYFDVERVSDSIRQAMQTYYQVNSVTGCMNPSAPNFDFRANLNGTCETPVYNQTFGGFYQYCIFDAPGYDPHRISPCPLNHMNILTNAFKCGVNYRPSTLLETRYWDKSAAVEHAWGQEVRRGYWLTVTTVLCLPWPNVPRETGFMFGGFYIRDQKNFFTGASSCPPNYEAYPIFSDSFICLSQNFALASADEVKFGGFFSCQADYADQRCPVGFTQHTAVVENGCEIMYCVEPRAFFSQVPALIRRPPFENPKSLRNETRNMLYFYHKNGTFWHKRETSEFVKNITEQMMNGTSQTNVTFTNEDLSAYIKNVYLPREMEKLEKAQNLVNEKESVDKNPVALNDVMNQSAGWLLGLSMCVILILLLNIASLIIIFKKLEAKTAKHQSE